MRNRIICAVGLLVAILGGAVRHAQTQQPLPGVVSRREIDPVLLTPPPIKAEPGFAATLVVPPGEMYDPLSVLPRSDGMLWINDDGGVAGDRGGYVWGVDRTGKVTRVIDASRMMPSTGFDVAPAGFGQWGGQILTLSTPTVARIGVQQSHIIERVDPRTRELSQTICTLPNHGAVNGGVPAAGIEARFGPPGSPFANRFFSITIRNNTIYQTTADGACKPFATFDGGPWGLAFSPDGSKMLVTVRRRTAGTTGSSSAKGTIVSVRPDGTIDSTPVFEHSDPTIFDVEVAPAKFGAYGGQLFFTDWGANMTEGSDKPPKWDGTLYRVSRDGKAHLVASGFSNPSGIAFVGNSIWVADVNRDGPFLAGQWVPDGFLVRIDIRKPQ